MQTVLFETENYLLTEIDHEKDPEIDSEYTKNLVYARYWCKELLKPLSKTEVKKQYESIEKRVASNKMIYFAVREKVGQRLIGFLRFGYIGWSHGVGFMEVGIGCEKHFDVALKQLIPLGLRYAFTELNLYRVEMAAPNYVQGLITQIKMDRFLQEVVNRENRYLLGDYHDEIIFGILRPEWNGGGR